MTEVLDTAITDNAVYRGPSAQAWFAVGERIGYDPKARAIVAAQDAPLKTFLKQEGGGSHAVTFLPGYPDGSFGWAKVRSAPGDPMAMASRLEKRFDRQPCCAGILYESVRFLIGHSEVNAAEEFLSFGCVRTERRLVSADINRIVNVAL
jgi:hypothetical protein